MNMILHDLLNDERRFYTIHVHEHDVHEIKADVIRMKPIFYVLSIMSMMVMFHFAITLC